MRLIELIIPSPRAINKNNKNNNKNKITTFHYYKILSQKVIKKSIKLFMLIRGMGLRRSSGPKAHAGMKCMTKHIMDPFLYLCLSFNKQLFHSYFHMGVDGCRVFSSPDLSK